MKKLYILIRKDLKSKGQEAVQAGHALAAFLLEHQHQGKEWGNHTLIYLSIPNEEELASWIGKLKEEGIMYSFFREPDIGNQMTAIACLSDGKVFANLKLL